MTGDVTWIWRFEDESGAELFTDRAPATGWPSQADAEAWIGEFFEVLREEDGIDQVVLLHGQETVYGPMSLKPAEGLHG